MSLEGSDQAGIVAIGAGALLGVAGAIFKAANLKGDSNSKWSSRVELAVLALDEKTVAELRELRDDIDDLLADADAPFDPSHVVSVDPGPLSARVEQTARYYSARVRMESNLHRVRQLGRVFVVGLSALALAIAALTLYFGELVDPAWLKWAGFVLGALGLVASIAAGIVYVVCVDRLSGDEILADTASQAGGGTG